MRPRILGVCMLIVATGIGASLAQQADKPPATPAAKLAQEIPSVKLANMPLARALNYYGDISGLAIEADWSGLEIAGITKDTPVTVSAQKLSFQKLLDLTLDSVARRNRPLAWYLSNGVVHVTSQMRAVLRDRVYSPATGSPGSPQPRGFGGVRQITFDQTPLRAAIEFFGDLTGANFHVNWRSLEAQGITRDTPITLKVQNVPISRALDLIMDQLNVGRDRFSSIYWLVDGGIVQIATGEVFNQTTKIRTYDIADLLMVVPNFKGPRIDLARTAGNNNVSGNNGIFGGWGGDNNNYNDDEDEEDEESITEQRERLKTTLIETIKLSIGEEMWTPNGKGSINLLRDRLIISQTPLGFKLLGEAFRQ